MATQSILKNIVINNPADAEIFVSAMERAADASEHSPTHTMNDKDLSGESLKNFLRNIKKNDTDYTD